MNNLINYFKLEIVENESMNLVNFRDEDYQ
jgi:hypothetical protein